jgi:hypothetical protein
LIVIAIGVSSEATSATVSDGMVYVTYGAQNNPSGGMIAYRLGR